MLTEVKAVSGDAGATRLRVARRIASVERASLVGLCVLISLCTLSEAESLGPALITSVRVSVGQDKIELKIDADRMLSVQTMVLTHPDRIVLDVAGAHFRVDNRRITIHAGSVKSLRIALWQLEPPITRIVVDTAAPVAFTVRREGKLAAIDIPLPSGLEPSIARVEKPPPDIRYDQGLLTIVASDSSLAEILNGVQAQMGATIEFPATAASERATVKLGPASPTSVLTALLQGSPFDYVIVGAGQGPGGIHLLLIDGAVHPEGQGTPVEELAEAADATQEASPFDGSAEFPRSTEIPQQDAGTQFVASGGVAVNTAERGTLTLGGPEQLVMAGQRPKAPPSKENPRFFPPPKKP
jgi:hypothetical protein